MPSLQLTERAARELSADQNKTVLYRDTAAPGLALRVTKNGYKAFVFNYSMSGRERRMRIGGFPSPWTVAAARQHAKELRQKVDQGVDPLEVLHQKEAEPDVQILWSAFKDVHLPTVSHKYASEQIGYWGRFILPKLGKRKLSSLGSHEIDALHMTISREKPVAANRIVSSLRKALNFAKRRGWVTVNVAEGVRNNREEGRQRYLTEVELQSLISALDRMPNKQAASAIRLLLLTGARRSEVLGAKWDEFDLNRGNWTKPSSRVKTRRETTIPLSGLALALLVNMSNASTSEYVFPSKTGGYIPDIKAPWAWLMKETELKSFRLHDLRHTHASILVNQGHSLELIGRLLGHTQTQTTARYAHLMQDPMRQALAGLDASFPRTLPANEKN